MHIEFAGKDGAKLEAFYTALFDWEIVQEDMGGYTYSTIKFPDNSVTGGIRHEPEGKAEVVLYVQVDDLNDAFARAQELGGSVRIPPMETPALTFALMEDPEGNPIGLVQKP